MPNVEQGILNVDGRDKFDLEKRLIEFAARIIQPAEHYFMIRHSALNQYVR